MLLLFRQRPFRPTRVSGLQFWLTADSLSLSDNDPVATWWDRSGNGRDATQGTAAARPTYQTNEVNGKPIVRFDGVDDYLATASLAGTSFFTANAATIFLVYKQPASSVTVIPFGWETHAITNQVTLYGAFSDNNFYFDYGDETGNAGRVSGAQPAGWDDAYHVVILRRSGTSQRITVDGTNVVDGTVSDDLDPTPSSALQVGRDVGSVSSAFDLAEMGIYNVAISSSEEAALKNYLAGKYGITVV